MALKKIDFKGAVNTVAKAVDQNSPTILTGLAVAGFIGTVILTIKAVPKAEKILAEQREKMKEIEEDDKEAKRDITLETVKEMAPVVIPPVVTGVTAIACCIGSNSVNLRRQAVLSAAYNVAQTTLTEYKDKIPEIVGQGKATKIRDAVNEEKVKNNPPSDKQIIVTGNGDVLCYDSYSARYFRCDPEKIREAVNDLNQELINSMYVSLNEFYDAIGLSQCKLGEQVGWNIDSGVISISFTSTLTENNVPCLVLDYDTELRQNFKDLY